MKGKSIMILGLIGTLSLGGISTTFGKTNKAPVTLKKIVAKKTVKQSVKVTSKEIKSENEFININIKIPVVQGMKDKSAEDKFNKNIESNIISFKEDMVKEAKLSSEEFKKQGFNFNHYEATSWYTVFYNKDNILSMTVSTYQYTGGAHGMEVTTSYNIDTKTGKNIALKDVFKKGVDYKKIINNEIKNEIKETKKEGYNFVTITDNQNFFFNKGALNIKFNAYDIAPYSEGAPLFEISVSKLKNYINPQFLVE